MASAPSIYFDHINGGPTLPEAIRAMTHWLARPANPQLEHSAGRLAQMALEAARAQVAGLIGAQPAEILFTASGTEANNLAIKGFLKANKRRGQHILVSAVEHPSVERACRRMRDDGYRLDILPVDHLGRVDPQSVTDALCDDTALVCVQLANPEVGSLQPIAEIAGRLKDHRAVLMVDAVAAAGRTPIDVTALGADMLTLAAAPMGGPAGAAALYLKRGVRVQPEIDGGIQEDGRRGGLENVAACVGFGAAALAAHGGNLTARMAHLNTLDERFRNAIVGLSAPRGEVRFTGPEGALRLAGHVSLLLPGIEGESLLSLLDGAGLAASSGSFCGARAMKASPVLQAMDYPLEDALSGILFSFGAGNSAPEVDRGAELLRQCVEQCQLALPPRP